MGLGKIQKVIFAMEKYNNMCAERKNMLQKGAFLS